MIGRLRGWWARWGRTWPELAWLGPQLRPPALTGAVVVQEVRCILLDDGHLSVFYPVGADADPALTLAILEAAETEVRQRHGLIRNGRRLPVRQG